MPFVVTWCVALAPGRSPKGETGAFDSDGDADIGGPSCFEAGSCRCNSQRDGDNEEGDGGSELAFSVVPRQSKSLLHGGPSSLRGVLCLLSVAEATFSNVN